MRITVRHNGTSATQHRKPAGVTELSNEGQLVMGGREPMVVGGQGYGTRGSQPQAGRNGNDVFRIGACRREGSPTGQRRHASYKLKFLESHSGKGARFVLTPDENALEGFN